MTKNEIEHRAEEVLSVCRAMGLTLATAESCTGGLISAALTAIPGSSDVFLCGVASYANAAKTRMLSVQEEMLARHGAVSAEVARAMAEGVLEISGADLAVAVTGIAGPGGATPSKPVGLVHLAGARKSGEHCEERHVFTGDRAAVRHQAALAALALVLKLTVKRLSAGVERPHH